MPVNFTPALIDQIIKGRCADFAAVMGMRKTNSGELQVNVFLPGATAVDVLQRNGKKVLATLAALHPEGLFSGTLPGKKAMPYKLRVHYGATAVVRDDPYRFSCRLDKAELQLFAQGQHDSAWQLLGAQRCSFDDVEGVQFVLWAPTAERVSLLCELNRWDGRCHVMRHHADFGLWELFIPGFSAQDGNGNADYKFEILTADHHCQNLPFDPFARAVSKRPVFCTHLDTENSYLWLDRFWQLVGRDLNAQGRAISIREVTLAAADDCQLNWKQLAPLVLEQTRAEGFTHVLLTARPAVSDHYSVCGLLAPDPALGSPNDLRTFIDRAHELELGVLWDVPLLSVLHSPGSEERPLALLQPQLLGGPLLSILLGYFSYWRESFHIDGFRVRDVDTLLQAPMAPGHTKKKSRHDAPGAGNPFVREWLSQLMQKLRGLHPGLLMMVETATRQEPFTLPAHKGGYGFDYRIPSDAGQTEALRFDARARISELLLALQDGNRDQTVLSLPWQQMVNTDAGDAGGQEARLAMVMLALWTLPGRKHVQLDCILKQGRQWNPDAGHDWELQQPAMWSDRAGRLLRDLNLFYQSSPCLYEVDTSHEGITVLHASEGVLAWQRMGRHANELLLIVVNTGNSPASAEISSTNSGPYHLRYHTPAPDGQADVFPKVVQSLACAASSVDVNHGQKLLLNLPACSGAIYAWQG